MKLEQPIVVGCDVLVIGSGGAGMRAAIEARRHGVDVLLVSKSRAGHGSNTAIAGGAMAVATGERDPEDSFEAHLRDIVTGGRYLSDQRLARAVVERGPGEVQALESFGVRFVSCEGRRRVTRAPGHSHPRTLVCEGFLGTGYTLPLRNYCQRVGVRFAEGILITDLLTAADGVAGALGLSENGQLYQFQAPSVVLALGGLGQVFAKTNNVASINGDGYAMAFEVGATLRDMEFVQFYPTAFWEEAETSWGVLYEGFVALPGFAIRNALGENILERYGLDDPAQVTRDRLTRAIMMEVVEGRSIEGALLFDLSRSPRDRVERLARSLPRQGGQIKTEFRVSPTTHFCMGGIQVDGDCQTALPGLYAAGEVCGGIHGANRLGSNALTACFAMGAIAGEKAARRAAAVRQPPDADKATQAALERLKELGSSGGAVNVEDLRRALKRTMWDSVGIVRGGEGLAQAIADIMAIRQRLPAAKAATLKDLADMVVLENMTKVSEMVARAARVRAESRGSHYRVDYPEENAAWVCNTFIRKTDEGMTLEQRPVEAAEIAVPSPPAFDRRL
jgi:succinate dehydrogenase/fumarate reductase flavoprotein subunit